MNDNTHPLVGTQRTVRAMQKMASDVARSEIASAKQLATVHTAKPFTVILDSSSTAVAAHHLSWYTPKRGDRVRCEVYGKQVMVLGTFDNTPTAALQSPFESSRTYAYNGDPAVGYLPAFQVGELGNGLATLLGVTGFVYGGTSVTLDLYHGTPPVAIPGSTIDGLTGLVLSTTLATAMTAPRETIPVAPLDYFLADVTAVSGTITWVSLTFYFKELP